MITIGTRVKVSSSFYVKPELQDNLGEVVGVHHGDSMTVYRVKLDNTTTLTCKVWAFYLYEMEEVKQLVGL